MRISDWSSDVCSSDLYAPLMARLGASSGTLKKLSFSVARTADVEQWADVAEDGLIDLRKTGSFRGKGTLQQKANEVLKSAWETGDSAEVIAAMAEFRRLYQKDLTIEREQCREREGQYV